MDPYECLRQRGAELGHLSERAWARALLYYQLRMRPSQSYATAEEIQQQYRKLGRQVPSIGEIEELLKDFKTPIGNGFEISPSVISGYDEAYSQCIPQSFWNHFSRLENHIRRTRPTIAHVVFWSGPAGLLVGILGLFYAVLK